MTVTQKRILTTLLIIALSALVFARQKQTGLYQVTEVYDGDTIAVNMNGATEKIRLIGVDTPETKDPRKPVQCYGPEASAYSHSILEHAKVRLVADPLSTNRDRYNRLLRYVYLQDGSFYNKKLLQSGFARAYIGFPFSKSNDFIVAEKTAKDNSTGLWNSCTS